jgi:hypothetical protein
MKLNEFEREVLGRFLADKDLRFSVDKIDMDAVTVADRSFTGIGFVTDVQKDENVRLLDDARSVRWCKVAARLNDEQIETGYVVYVDGGYLSGLEGFTYGGQQWPLRIGKLDLYSFDPTSGDLRKGES